MLISELVMYISGFLDLFGVSMIMPLLPTHARELGASTTLAGVYGSLYGAIQLFSSPLFGQWSDVAGRRRILLICLLCTATGYTMFGIATTIPLMFLFRIPLGIFKHSQTISKSYLADTIPAEKRSEVYGNFNAASSIGFIVGPMVAGHIAEHPGGFYLVALLTGAIFILNTGLIWWFIKEPQSGVNSDGTSSSNSKQNSMSETTNSAKKLQKFDIGFREVLTTFKKIEWACLWDLLLAKFLLAFSIMVFRSNFSLVLHEKFDTSPKIIGYIISFNSFISAVIGFGVGIISNFYRNNSRLLLHMSLIQVITLLILALAPSLWIFVAALIPLSLVTTTARVASTSLTIERGRNHDVGTILGASQSVLSTARMLSPLIAGIAQEMSISGPGIAGSLCAFIATCVMGFVHVPQKEYLTKEKSE